MTRYKQAIAWIVLNEDLSFLSEDTLSVTAALVADVFGKTDDKVRADIIKVAAIMGVDTGGNTP